MKKLIFTLLSAVFALSAFAQLTVPFTFTQDNFNDGSIVVANVNEGIAKETAKWDGGVYFGGTGIWSGTAGWNWEDKYIVVAISGIPDKLTFSTSTDGSATDKKPIGGTSNGFWFVCQSTANSFTNKLWESKNKENTPDIQLSQDTRYLKLCYTGNLNGTMKNIKVTKYTPVATAATAVTANSFTANWNAAKGTNITYTLEVSDANGVVKTIDNLTGTSYTVEDLNPLTAYSYVVYVVANGATTSDASNVIEVTTLPLTPTTALEATDVTFNSFTANWKASDLEGAKYSIEVKNSTDETIASASGLEETSYAVSNLEPEHTYKYVVYVTVGDATSEASNTISVTTSEEPTTPTITPITSELNFNTTVNTEENQVLTINTVKINKIKATITVDDDEFYFKDGDNIVKTIDIDVIDNVALLNVYFLSEAAGEFNNSITLSATDAENVTITLNAEASKPVITPVEHEYKILSDTDIEGLTSVLITTVNVTEATATITGDAEFYFKDADGKHVTSKTVAIEAEGPTEFELFHYFTEDGDYSATITIRAKDADDAVVTALATVSKPTDVPESTTPQRVKSFSNDVLEFNADYADITVATLAGRTVAHGKGHTITLAQGQTYLVKLVDLEGNASTIKVK